VCCVEGPAGGALGPKPHKPTLKGLAPPRRGFRFQEARHIPSEPPQSFPWVNLMVESGHRPSWPRIETRSPSNSSSHIFSMVPAFPSVRRARAYKVVHWLSGA
jgi:hypothetical protein